jgi:4-hydroxybenzoate polyprenyltransferase
MVGNYLRLVKFSHTLFSMPFALASFFLAMREEEAELSWRLLGLVVLCVVLARNAAMGFNRYADHRYDIRNPRTSKREIPAGIINPRSALAFVVINALLFMAAAWFINPLCFYLSPVALAVILGYSITKRFTPLCHLILGVGLALAPLGAWLAVTGKFHPVPVLLACSVLCWVSGFDIIYALQDEEFDKAFKLRSIPAAIGKKRALLISTLLHLVSFGFLVSVTILSGLGITGTVGTSLFGLLLLYQHLIISPTDISRVNISFFTTNGIASLLWAAFVIAGILTGT